jgi:hypothetical protein
MDPEPNLMSDFAAEEAFLLWEALMLAFGWNEDQAIQHLEATWCQAHLQQVTPPEPLPPQIPQQMSKCRSDQETWRIWGTSPGKVKTRRSLPLEILRKMNPHQTSSRVSHHNTPFERPQRASTWSYGISQRKNVSKPQSILMRRQMTPLGSCLPTKCSLCAQSHQSRLQKMPKLTMSYRSWRCCRR